MRLVMPAAIFDPQAPVATITVPAELVQHPVMVEATDAEADA